MEKEEDNVDKGKALKAINVIQVLMNEFGKQYIEEGEFTLTIMQKGGTWSLFVWPNDIDLNIVENNIKLALMQVNQVKVTREKMEEDAKGRKVQEQYVA